MSARRNTIRIVLVILVLVAAGWAMTQWVIKRPTTGAELATVRRGTIAASVDALGRVQPVRQMTLSLRASGIIRRVHVRKGDRVIAGQLLLELADDDYQDAIAQAERAYRVRQAQLTEALQAPSSSEIEVARQRLRRATAARQNAQSRYDKIARQPDADSSDEAVALELAKLEYELAKADFDQTMLGPSSAQSDRLRADVQEAEMALRQAKQRQQETRLFASFAGTVMALMVQEGENSYAYNPLVVLADLSRLEIKADVDEMDVVHLGVGQRVHVRIDAMPAETLEGTIARIAPGASDTRGATTYETIVTLGGTELPLRPGMGASLTITTRTADNALVVPRRAIRQVGRYKVVTVRATRRDEQVTVTTGLSNEAEMEVLSGLAEGQLVVLE